MKKTDLELKNSETRQGKTNFPQERNNFYVYHLIDPRNNLPFYIGKGHGRRMYSHENETKRNQIPHNNKHLYYKIKKILRLGQCVIYKKILKSVNEEIACLQESIEIQFYGRKDNKTGVLCNMTDGGDGTTGYVYTNERKISQSKLWTKEMRDAISKLNKGRKHTEESRRNRSKQRKIFLSNPKNNPMYGKHLTKQHKQKMSNALCKKKIYTFLNIKTNKKFTGTINKFRKKFNLRHPHITGITKGTHLTTKNWLCINSDYTNIGTVLHPILI